MGGRRDADFSLQPEVLVRFAQTLAKVEAFTEGLLDARFQTVLKAIHTIGRAFSFDVCDRCF